MPAHFDVIDREKLDDVSGGLPNGIPSQPSEPEPKTWIDGLNRNLRDRGYNPDIDPNMSRQPQNPDMDKGIVKPWDPFAAPRGEQGT